MNYIIAVSGYNDFMLADFNLGDIVRMRKAHPCGGFDWKIVRLGADIGLICTTCQHRIMLSRRELAKKMKSIVTAVTPDHPNQDSKY